MTKGSASAVDKALDLLEAIARSTTPMTLSELAEEVGMLRPTAHRVLGELASRGWVFRYDGRYLPGPAALQVSHEAAAHSLAALCNPALQALSERTDMMVNLQVLESSGSRIIAALRPDRLKMITRMLGDLLPPHRFAGPLAFLAALDASALAPYLKLVEQAGYPLDGPNGFLADIEETRATGFAVVHKRSRDIIGSVSRAACSRKGSPLCAVTVIGFDSDFDDDTVAMVQEHLRRTTDDIEQLLTDHAGGKRSTESGDEG
ncbi:helix-turn-helix domain-containing protein [Rhodococcus sp. IEGM 1379]|uniref:IclR family transcriptional regulator n=1 Tax=Rhodococcus sp. IEGM 1379 TaxID=3047086 RepID=UPI0024B7EFB8|nr:helix-turn-helix domain-containing protein [Rhodococcus sp. IEGM 1379]MDI9916595.1 helix-turn-helix domain-containing protein [Rhodococcus sp. IEGM 1379]